MPQVHCKTSKTSFCSVDLVLFLLSNPCHLAFTSKFDPIKIVPAVTCISWSIDFKNLLICIEDEKGTPGKPCYGPATGIPQNDMQHQARNLQFSQVFPLSGSLLYTKYKYGGALGWHPRRVA